MDDIPLPTIKAPLDQLPVGNTNKMMIDQYPPDFDPTKIQTKAQPLPLGKRLSSKVLKTKKQALEQLLKIVSNQDHRSFVQHESVILTSMADSNAQCQILSSKILYQYLEKQGSFNGQPKVIIKNVVQKILTIQKQEYQTIGMNILFWMMDHSYQQMLLNDLNDYLNNKNPKIIGCSLKVIQTLLNNYGHKKLGCLQVFNKSLKLLAEAARPMAKPQTIELFKQVFKWMGDACFSSFNMHHQVKDQVTKWSKTYQMQPMQIKRGLKKGEQGKKINPMELQQQDHAPVDILLQYDSRWVDSVLQKTKWQQKKQLLQDFIKKTNVGNIVPRQTSHFITLIKRLFNENNINLLTCGFKIVRNLCRGLKKGFAVSCKSFLSYVYLKLKDNKAMIVDQTLATLKAMTYSITLQDFQQQITQGLKDKSPQMRYNTLKLLRDLSAKKEQKTSKILKTLLNTLIALTNDSNADVRDIALNVLCKIKQHHGMIFFEDKIQSLPQKKANLIRSTPTISSPQQNYQKMEVQQPTISLPKSVTNTSIANNLTKNNPKIMSSTNQNKVQPNKKAIHSMAQPQMGINKSYSKPQQIVEKKPIVSEYKKPQMEMMSRNLPTVHEQSRPTMNQQNQRNNQHDQLMKIQNEQWPIVPTPGHVLRLINLFSKLGQPFVTLATPFKLKHQHLAILQNCQNTFMTQNANLLLKWALWRIQIQNPQIIQKITSVVIHLIFLLKTNMSDSQTILIMSILSNLLQSEFTKMEILQFINTNILEISQFLRQKVFNFWITTLKQNSGNVQFCQKILNLLTKTFEQSQFTPAEAVTMSRVQVIVRNKKFMNFLLQKCNRQFLQISGFKFQYQQISGYQSILKYSDGQFNINMSVDERRYYSQIFKRHSNQSIQQIRGLDANTPINQSMNLHIKIIDTILLPYLNRTLQPINIFQYFNFLKFKISYMIDNDQIQYILPNLRNLMRLLMFFLIDINQSKLDNKDQLSRTVNKILIYLLEKMPCDHLLQIMTMLLNYGLKNNLTKRLTQLLLKCINKTVQNINFQVKSQKNVRLLFNFFIGLIHEHKIQDEDQIIKTIKTIFVLIMSHYKELCIQPTLQKLKQYNNQFISKQLQHLFKSFIGYNDNKNQQPLKQQDNNHFANQNSSQLNSNNLNNNIQINNQMNSRSKFQNMNNQQENNINNQNLKPNPVIRQATNLQRSDFLKSQTRVMPNISNDLIENNGTNIPQQRRRVVGLQRQFDSLVRMKENLQTLNQARNNQLNNQIQPSNQVPSNDAQFQQNNSINNNNNQQHII